MFKFFARIGYTIAVIIQAMIGIRFVVLLLNINTQNAIVSKIMEITGILVSPFKGVLSNENIILNGLTVNLTSVVAFFFFLVLGFITIEVVKAFSTD